MPDPNLIREAWALYERLDLLRYREAQKQVHRPEKKVDYLLRLDRLCKRSYARFERRCRRF